MDPKPVLGSTSSVAETDPPVSLPFARWLLLIVALSGALWTQLRIQTFDNPSQAGLLLLFCGLVVVLAAPRPLRDGSGLVGRVSWLGTRSAWIAGCAALILSALSVALLWKELSSGLGLLCWFLAMTALCAGFWSLRPVVADEDRIRAWFPVSSQPSRFVIPRSLEVALLLIILAGALLVRNWDIAIFPDGLQSDEGNNGVEALKWLSGAPYTPYSEANEGQASFFTYLIALSFSLFGPTLEAMRGVSVAVGVVTVAVFYFFSRQHLTPLAALAGTALLAFSRWHITFSRIVYELILTPLAVILVFHFLYQGLRHRRMRDFILAGLSLAFGFNTYTGFRTVPIGVALFCLYWLVTQRRQIGTTVAGVLVMGASALIGLIPLAIYTIQKPDVVLLRTQKLNLLGEIDAVGSLAPLWTNLRNYLLMFNLRGDPVAINNLPGEPALTWIVAALALVGLVYVVRYLNDPRLFLAVAWIVATLPAGILSVTLESPSSRRVIGILPLACFLAAIAVDLFWRQSARVWRGRVRWGWAAVLTAVIVIAAYNEVDLFFNRQVKSESVRMAFSPVESAIARYIASQDGQAVLYINQAFRNHSAIQFIARNPDYIVLDMAPHLPLPQPHEQQVIYILSLEDARLRFLFEQFYPSGLWEAHATDFGVPLFYTFTVTAEQQLAAVGLLVQTTPLRIWDSPTGNQERTAGAVPPTDIPAEGAGVVWSGSLRVPAYGVYGFRLEGVDAASLRIDGEELLIGGMLTGQKELAGGFHDFVLAADVNASSLPVLLWSGPIPEQPVPELAFFTFPAPPFGLTGVYYANPNWEGVPVQVQQDVVIASTDALVSPYSIVWTGEIQIDAPGPYSFGTTSDDGSFVYVNGQLAVDNGGQHGAEYREGPPLELSAGRHAIEIRYFQDGGSHKFELYWISPATGHSLVPPDRLLAGPADRNPAASLPGNVNPAALLATPTPMPETEQTVPTPMPVEPSPLQTPESPVESLSPLPTAAATP